eukprot:2834302-Pleurochrysis_carterae.AAC.6
MDAGLPRRGGGEHFRLRHLLRRVASVEVDRLRDGRACERCGCGAQAACAGRAQDVRGAGAGKRRGARRARTLVRDTRRSHRQLAGALHTLIPRSPSVEPRYSRFSSMIAASSNGILRAKADAPFSCDATMQHRSMSRGELRKECSKRPLNLHATACIRGRGSSACEVVQAKVVILRLDRGA